MPRARASGTRIYRVEVDGRVLSRHTHAVPAIAHAERVDGLVVGSDGCLIWSAWPTVEGDHWMDVASPLGVAATPFAWLRYHPARVA